MAHIINNSVLPKGIEEEELEIAIRQEEWDKIVTNSESDKMLLLDMALDVINHWNCRVSKGTMIFLMKNWGIILATTILLTVICKKSMQSKI